MTFTGCLGIIPGAILFLGVIMKIINLLTNIIFDLPKSDAEQLLSVSPNMFAKLGKNNKIIKQKNNESDTDTVLGKILEK